MRADGTTVSFAYSQTANEATVRTTSPDNVVSSSVTDGFGRKVRTVQDADAAALTTSYTYHPYGPLNTVASPGGQRFVHTHDTNGRLASTQAPAQTLAEIYTYDAYDRVATVRQPNNVTRVNTYTKFSELETVSIAGVVEQIRYRYPLSAASHGIYALGQPYETVSKLQDGSGSVTETVLARDQWGRPKTQRTSLPWGVTDTYAYTYHASGAVGSVVPATPGLLRGRRRRYGCLRLRSRLPARSYRPDHCPPRDKPASSRSHRTATTRSINSSCSG